MMVDDFIAQRKKEVENNKIILYIKGTKENPQCGFSDRTIQIFNQVGKPFATVDILANPEIRYVSNPLSKSRHLRLGFASQTPAQIRAGMDLLFSGLRDFAKTKRT